jgi:ABC-2 type transport system permease protein
VTPVIRAELTKLARRPVLLGMGIGAVLFAVVSSLTVFLTAAPDGPPTGRSATLETLARPGGGTEAFALGVSFIGLLVLVVVVANFTGEYSRGTFRTLLMREPRRVRLLAGKTTALLIVIALVLAAAGGATWVASVSLAPSQGVAMSEWFTLDALGDNLGDYGTALLTVAGWAFLGMALGVLLRSTTLALAIGVAWAGPFEHLAEDGWSGAGEWFPGLLLETLAAGGTANVAQSRALVLVLVYAAVAVALAAAVFRRRDVTA